MPRQTTEASAYLDLYKLVNERKRLEQELARLNERRDRIQTRIQELTAQTDQLRDTATQLQRGELHRELSPPIAQPQTGQSDAFHTLFLEY